MKRRRLMRFLKWTALLLTAPLAAGVGVLLLLGARDGGANADCIVVPGAALRKGRRPSNALEYRLEGALRLYRQGRAPVIIVTGGGEGDWDEAAAMADWLAGQGVPRDAIITENASATTRDSGVNVARIMRERGLKSALVCSQWFHVARARLCLRQEGVSTLAAPCGGNTLLKEPWYVLRETAALPAYALRLDELRS